MANEPSAELVRPVGLIFDLDGTLVDTVPARIDGWVEVLSAEGFEVSRAEVGPKIGMDGRRLAREVAAANGRELDDQAAERIDRAAGEAFDRRNTAPRTLPGLASVLATIEDLGLPWVIATSSRKAQVAVSVAALGIEHEPDIVDGSHVEHAKPAPDLLLLAAERLGLPPERCWAVGDSTWDIRAAAAAGMAGIGVTAGSAVPEDDLRAAGAARVVASLEDLAALLRGGAASSA
jgi:HAD superfamily hydrolase (TIGR01509 family)